MALIHVSDLPPHRRDEALGLVKLGSGHSAEEWMRCLRPGDDEASGVLSACATSGVLLGVAAWKVGKARAAADRVLRVPLFVAFELGRDKSTAAALRGGLDRLGEKLGCGALLFDTAGQE